MLNHVNESIQSVSQWHSALWHQPVILQPISASYGWPMKAYSQLANNESNLNENEIVMAFCQYYLASWRKAQCI